MHTHTLIYARTNTYALTHLHEHVSLTHLHEHVSHNYAHEHKNAEICNTYCFSIETVVTWNALMLRYTYIACAISIHYLPLKKQRISIVMND